VPADYQCVNCHQLVCVDVGMAGVIFPEGGGPEARVRVRCPHCGTENSYRVPRQAPEEYQPTAPAPRA
jgi:hypothetical protein